MSLLGDASALVKIVLNDLTGFAVPIQVTSPIGITVTLRGLAKDIALSIDPETGVAVSGRKASVSLDLDAVQDAFGAVPEGIPDEDDKPWLVTWTPATGSAQTMKIMDVMPDKLGVLVCHVEAYRPR